MSGSQSADAELVVTEETSPKTLIHTLRETEVILFLLLRRPCTTTPVSRIKRNPAFGRGMNFGKEP